MYPDSLFALCEMNESSPLPPSSHETQIRVLTDLHPNPLSIVLLVEALIVGNSVFTVHKSAEEVNSLESCINSS